MNNPKTAVDATVNTLALFIITQSPRFNSILFGAVTKIIYFVRIITPTFVKSVVINNER